MASWVRGKCLGKGVFGTVSVGVRKSDSRVFAVKSVDLKMGLPCQVEALENEIRILRSMSSPYVVGFLGDDVTCEGDAAPATTSYRNMHLEYLPGGTVADLAHRNGGEDADVDERPVRYYTWCVVHALRYAHSRGLVHCDVKGRNVLVGANGSVAKLADFGSAVEFSSAAGIVPRGSPLWMAPEVIRREYQGPESDVWSLGCTVIEMVTGKPAWEDHGVDTLSRIAYSGELPEFPSQLSELGHDFLDKCLRREPSQRWSCDQLLQHPFLCSAAPNILMYSSPRCVLDWVHSEFADEDEEENHEEEFEFNSQESAKDRIGKLATSMRVNWESEEDWVAVRALASDTAPTATMGSGSGDEGEEGTCSEYPDSSRVEEAIDTRRRWEYSDSIRAAKTERANPEIRKFGGRRWLVWRCDQSDRECKEKVAVWGCRYALELEKLDLVVWMRRRTVMSIRSLCCKLLKSHSLLTIYFMGIICILYLIFLASTCECDQNFFSAFGYLLYIEFKIEEKKIRICEGLLNI